MGRGESRRRTSRGGLGVRKRLSEESLRPTYRLNGVPTGSVVARCLDRYGRWEGGYVLGVIARRTASTVQIRWMGDDEISSYSQGDARYEVDRGRWRILGRMGASPLGPPDSLALAIDRLRGDSSRPLTCDGRSAMIDHAADHGSTPSTEEKEMTEKLSRAAAERAAAQRAVANGELRSRATYTAKQVAARCGTDPKTMRKFFRSKNSTVTAVGQGGRYEFDAADFPQIKREFDAWTARSQARRPPTPTTSPKKPGEDTFIGQMAAELERSINSPGTRSTSSNDMTMEQLADAIERTQNDEPTEEELQAIEQDLDLDDLDGEELG